MGDPKLFGAKLMIQHDNYYGTRFEAQAGISFFGAVGVTAGIRYWEKDPDGLFRDGWSVNAGVHFAGGTVRIEASYNFRYKEIKAGLLFGIGEHARINVGFSYSAVRGEFGFNCGLQLGNTEIGFNYKRGYAGTYDKASDRWTFDKNSTTTTYGFNVGTVTDGGQRVSFGYNRSETVWRDNNGRVLCRDTSNGFNVGYNSGAQGAETVSIGYRTGKRLYYNAGGDVVATTNTGGLIEIGRASCRERV